MKRYLLVLLAILSMGAQSQAQKFLDIYKDGHIVGSVKAADVDSMVVGDDPDNRTLDFYHDGEVFHHTKTVFVDSVKIYKYDDEPLIYLGIVGFNQELYEKPFGILDKNKANDYMTFVSNLNIKGGTLLYYGVDYALDMLESKTFPSQVSSVNLITFTDGLDQGSLMKNSNYTTEEQYLNDVSNRIKTVRIKDLPLTAYSLGIRGSDVKDYSKFQNNLKMLASSSDKAFEVNTFGDVYYQFQNISNQIISVSNKQTISMKIPGQSEGTLIRFAFEDSVGYSPLYIEGTFNLSDCSLRNVTYHGLKAESGSVIQGQLSGIFVTYTFTGLQREDGNGLISTNNIRQYCKSPSSTTWQENSEFTPDNNTQTTITHSGAIVMLALDCSNSLGSQFYEMRTSANNFINRVANNAAEGIERPFGNRPKGNGETFVVNGVEFYMVKVVGGTFRMGATSEQGIDYWAVSSERPVHQVTLSDYSIGETEVTQELWRAVMGSNPSDFSGSDQLPVENVSWDDCQEFIKKLNQLTGQNFRLPTEAEWEFAARGGNASKGFKYAGSNNIGDVAWYLNNSSNKTHEVGTKSPNELCLYDMSGNVKEWCQDWYDSYSSTNQTNPIGPSSGSARVSRGGCWCSDPWGCRVSCRGYGKPSPRYSIIGFRLAQ